jgi:hypothetical protein
MHNLQYRRAYDPTFFYGIDSKKPFFVYHSNTSLENQHLNYQVSALQPTISSWMEMASPIKPLMIWTTLGTNLLRLADTGGGLDSDSSSKGVVGSTASGINGAECCYSGPWHLLVGFLTVSWTFLFVLCSSDDVSTKAAAIARSVGKYMIILMTGHQDVLTLFRNLRSRLPEGLMSSVPVRTRSCVFLTG